MELDTTTAPGGAAPERRGPLKVDAAADGGSFETDLLRWRQRMLSRVLWVGFAIGLLPLVLINMVTPEFLLLRFRIITTVVFAAALALALAGDLFHDLRAWAFLALGYVIAAVMLAIRGLGGSGRLFLVVLPLYAAVLVGPRSGWAAAGVSVVLYAVVALLHASGLVMPVPFDREALREDQFWLLQGAMLIFVLGPIMLLLTRFIGLLRGALAGERAALASTLDTERERRRLERVLLETAERERREVGHQLHDGPCQQITAALLRCRVAQNAMSGGEPPAVAGHLDAIAEMLDASVGEIHDLARGLSPAPLAPGALASALSDLARRVRASSPAACEFVNAAPGQVDDPEVTSQLFRVAQEAVGNAVRHASAASVEIKLAATATGVRLTVRDDGVGIAPDAGFEGMGLRIMRHRAELVGGSLTVEPARGGGTLVTCEMPVAWSESDPSGRA